MTKSVTRSRKCYKGGAKSKKAHKKLSPEAIALRRLMKMMKSGSGSGSGSSGSSGSKGSKGSRRSRSSRKGSRNSRNSNSNSGSALNAAIAAHKSPAFEQAKATNADTYRNVFGFESEDIEPHLQANITALPRNIKNMNTWPKFRRTFATRKNVGNIRKFREKFFGKIVGKSKESFIVRGAEGALEAALAEAVSKKEYLKELYLMSMVNKKAATPDIRSIAEILHHLKSLTKLDLSVNIIGDKRARIIAEELPHLRELKELNLSFNEIGSHGVEAIVESLVSLPKLKVLDLGENNIHEAGALAIAKVIPSLLALESLDLQGNVISLKGATELVKAIRVKNTSTNPLNKKLRHLHLAANNKEINEKIAHLRVVAGPECTINMEYKYANSNSNSNND